MGLTPRQAAARGVVADSVAVHRSTASWLTARLAAAGPTEGVSTAAGPTAGGLTAGGHTSRLAAGGPTAGGFTSLIASWGAGGLAADGLTASGPAANGLTAGGLAARGAARVGHCVCDEDGLLFRSEFLRFCSLLLFWGFYILDPQLGPISRTFLVVLYVIVVVLIIGMEEVAFLVFYREASVN